MNFLNKTQTRNEYNIGNILQNRHNDKYVIVFKCCGVHFTSNFNRARKGKLYRLDDPFWCKQESSLLKKIKLIITRKVKRIKRKSK